MTRSDRPFFLRPLRLALWLALLAGAFWRPAAARIDREPDYPIAPLRITERGGEMGFIFDYLREDDKDDGYKTSQSYRAFEEYLLYRLKGYTYHPRLLEFDTRFKLGFLQQVVTQSGLDHLDGFDGGSSDATLLGYDVNLTFLKDQPFTATFHANRDRSPVMELFTDQQLIQTDNLGAGFNWKKGPFPMDLSVNDSRIKQWGFETRTDTRIKSLDYAIRNNFRDWMTSELTYRYQDYKENFHAGNDLPDFDNLAKFKTHDLAFTNTIFLDPSKRSYLLTNLRQYKQSGTQDLETDYWSERLQYQLSPNLRAYALASYLENRLKSSTTRTWREEAGLDYQLFRSLETHFDLHWLKSEYGDLTEKEWGPTGRINYHKEVPLGYLTVGYARTLDKIERSGGFGVNSIVGEEIKLDDIFLHFLANPDVIAASVAVRDTARLVTFLEGFDYEIQTRGNRTGIRIVPGGRIAKGTTVLVDYDVGFTSNFSYKNDDQDFNINYELQRGWLQGLSLYYRWHDLKPKGAPEDDFSVLEFNDWLAGFAYKWRFLTWTEEYEQYTSNYSNYDQILSQIEASRTLSHGIRLGWNAGVLLIDYKDDDLPQGQDYDNVLFTGATLRGPIMDKGYWEVEARARKETGQFDELLLGVLGKVGLRWRKMRIEGGARAEQQDRYNNEQNRFNVFLQIAREF